MTFGLKNLLWTTTKHIQYGKPHVVPREFKDLYDQLKKLRFGENKWDIVAI